VQQLRTSHPGKTFVINRAKSPTLLAAIPVLALADDWLVRDISAIAAALLLLLSIGASQDDLRITVRLLRPILIALLFPIAWMVLQIAPLNPLANSIWPTASTALNESVLGHISIDPGATVRSLFAYLSMASLMIATMVFTRDRERAETTLFVTCAVTAFMSFEVLLGQFQHLTGIVPAPGNPAAATFVAVSVLGAVLNVAAAVRIIERRIARREEVPILRSVLMFSLSLTGSAICLAAAVITGGSNILIVAAFGIVVIIIIGAVRLVVLGPLAAGALFALLALSTTATVVLRVEGSPAAPPILRFATSPSPDSLSVTQRALADVKWLGSGAGTFDALAPIYRDFGAKPAIESASAITAITIEWGRAALIALVIIAIQLFVVTARGGLRRGRDWFFPGAASACIIALFWEAFCDSSLVHPSSQILVAVILGLGLSQTLGRTSGL
jgi:hypothetical protein